MTSSTMDLFGHEAPAKASKFAALFSAASDEWPTDQAVVDDLSARFGPFTLDPCCTAESAKAPAFFTMANDGLRQRWFGVVWLNPPYSDVEAWVRKALDESANNGVEVVMLLPARTDTRWFHLLLAEQHRCEFLFARGRLRFGAATGSAPFPSVVIVMRPT